MNLRIFEPTIQRDEKNANWWAWQSNKAKTVLKWCRSTVVVSKWRMIIRVKIKRCVLTWVLVKHYMSTAARACQLMQSSRAVVWKYVSASLSCSNTPIFPPIKLDSSLSPQPNVCDFSSFEVANLPFSIRVHTTLLASMCRALPF